MNKTTHHHTDAHGHPTMTADLAPKSDTPVAHTVQENLQIAVVDAGRKMIPFDTRDGRLVRNGWETTFDPKTDTITVWRDHEKSVLGHTPLPAFPRLTDEQAHRIARDVRNRALDGELNAEPYCFYDETDALDTYLDEVAAAIEHPTWCEREDCWDRHPLSSVEHTRKATSHQWKHEGLEHTVTAELQMYSESVTPTADETADMRVRIESSELGEVLLLGTPEDFRGLGQCLVTAADDLEWELDDANVSTPDVYKCRCGCTIADGPVLDEGDPTTDELIADHEATCPKAVR